MEFTYLESFILRVTFGDNFAKDLEHSAPSGRPQKGNFAVTLRRNDFFQRLAKYQNKLISAKITIYTENGIVKNGAFWRNVLGRDTVSDSDTLQKIYVKKTAFTLIFSSL